MSLNDEVRILRQVPLFAGVDMLSLKRLAFASHHRHYGAGDVLFSQGELGDGAYLLLEGNAEVLVDSAQGQIKVADIPERTIIGEIAVLCDAPRTATVRAVTPTNVLVIERDDLIRLLQADPQVSMAMLRILAERLSATTEDLIEARSHYDS